MDHLNFQVTVFNGNALSKQNVLEPSAGPAGDAGNEDANDGVPEGWVEVHRNDPIPVEDVSIFVVEVYNNFS